MPDKTVAATAYRQATDYAGTPLYQHGCGHVKAFDRPPSSGAVCTDCGYADAAASWVPLYREVASRD